MGLHHEATVDFVVGPKLLIEVFGLPRFQSQVTKYNVNRKKKEDAIKAAGWTLIALEPSDRELREEHLNIILDRWAESSDEQAVALYHTIKDAGCWRDGSPSTLRLLELVNDARARYKGDVEPASPRGLYEPDPDDHNPLSDAMRRCKPRIVLAQHYGRDAVGTPAEKSLQHLGGESVQPTVPAPAQPETPSLNSVTSSNSPAARSSTPHVEPDAQSYKEDMKRPDALAYEDDDDDEHDDDGFDAFLPDTL